MCYYTKVYFNIVPTIHKKYRKQNKQPKSILVRQIILEINSLDMQTHRNFLFLVVSLFCFSLTNIFYLALSQSEFPMNNCINVNLMYICSFLYVQ
jgi:hypothetical protein